MSIIQAPASKYFDPLNETEATLFAVNESAWSLALTKAVLKTVCAFSSLTLITRDLVSAFDNSPTLHIP